MAVVEVEQDGAVRWVWLNRPERLNAINAELGAALFRAVQDAAKDTAVRAVVLAGRGRAFCAGDDLAGTERPRSSVHAERRSDYLHAEGRWPEVAKVLVTMPKPVVAMLHGHAHGAGWDLALSCDFRLADADLQASHAYIRRGLASGVSRLPAFVGMGVASDLLMRGARLTAQHAHELGLVTEVVKPGTLEARTREFASELAAAPTIALGLLKEALGQAYSPGHDHRMWLQAGIAADALVTEDAAEGRVAFVQKREPTFQGR
ncbi:MAG: enoyl-CoA hydratase/isomerase family protein [Dehalococcoidia bacterium]|nr:enoyl-CoA hydratase/isomerase family protein [Dehalococcoidia bacterium]